MYALWKDAMIITFIIPNRDDLTKPPTLYEEWGSDVVPRKGEYVYLDGENGIAWKVYWVRYTYQLGEAPQVHVRLIEPDHWSLND